MKITFTLEGTTFEDETQIQMAMKAQELAFALNDLDQWLRSQVKYGEKEEYQPVRDKLYEFMNERGVTELVNR